MCRRDQGRLLFIAQCAIGLSTPGACARDSGDPGDLRPSVAIAYGTVSTPQGTPVPDAWINIQVRGPQECDAVVKWSGPPDGTAKTDGSGFYRVLITWIHVSRMERCLAVRAIPLAGSGLQEGQVAGARVTFIHEALTPPIDSVRIDVTLAPR
jgi:hypothetical protein